MSEVREFVSPKPGTGEPGRFALTMWTNPAPPGEPVAIRREFSTRPVGTVSFGLLMKDLAGPEAAIPFAVFRRCLVAGSTDPDVPGTEFDRWERFITDPDLYIHQSTLVEQARALAEDYAERPTQLSIGSTATPRPGPRGSTAKRQKRT